MADKKLKELGLHHINSFIDLGEAMLIFHKYHNPAHRPLDAGDNGVIVNIDPEIVSDEDLAKLGLLGWVSVSEEYQAHFYWNVT